MGKKTQRIIFQIVLAVAVVVLQVLSIRFRYFYEQRLEAFDHSLESVGITLLMHSFSLLSGFALAWLTSKRLRDDERPKSLNIGLLLLFIFTLLLVVINVLMIGSSWATGIFIAPLRPYKPFGSWVLLTPVPSLLAGFSLGRLLCRKLKFIN